MPSSSRARRSGARVRSSITGNAIAMRSTAAPSASASRDELRDGPRLCDGVARSDQADAADVQRRRAVLRQRACQVAEHRRDRLALGRRVETARELVGESIEWVALPRPREWPVERREDDARTPTVRRKLVVESAPPRHIRRLPGEQPASTKAARSDDRLECVRRRRGDGVRHHGADRDGRRALSRAPAEGRAHA